jgi:acyl-ACP thioesterase
MSFAAAARDFPMIAPSGVGRSLTRRRRVRLGDVSPGGRLRLDAALRFLQDVANDDARDAGWDDPGWVVRRSVVDVLKFPQYLEEVDLTTWCGALSPHWAERRTRITSIDGEILMDTAALWVHVDLETMRPSKVPDEVVRDLVEASGGRSVSGRLILRTNHFDEHPLDVVTQQWTLRYSDFDYLKHMNNAAYWAIFEDHLKYRKELRNGIRAVVEHILQIEPQHHLIQQYDDRHDGISIRLLIEDVVHAHAWIGMLDSRSTSS